MELARRLPPIPTADSGLLLLLEDERESEGGLGEGGREGMLGEGHGVVVAAAADGGREWGAGGGGGRVEQLRVCVWHADEQRRVRAMERSVEHKAEYFPCEKFASDQAAAAERSARANREELPLVN
eukprot:1477534-Rhodomonas_salina.1